MNLAAITEYLKDPYERKARVFPGLIVVLPILMPLLLILGPKISILASLVTLITSCGAIYALASIARGMGKRLEDKLVASWGGIPTTLILRHRDKFLDGYSKQKIHELFKSKLGIALPSPDEENVDPIAADDLYVGATRELRELTRGKSHGLLLKENTAYGFHRNMMAMRPFGATSCFVGILFGLILTKAIQLKPFSFDFSNLADIGFESGLTLAVSITLLFAWMYFGESSVRRMGYVYSERLFETLKSLPTRRKPFAKGSKSEGG